MLRSSGAAIGVHAAQNAKLNKRGARWPARWEMAVIDTDSATLPPARWVRILLTLPGGAGDQDHAQRNAGPGLSNSVSNKGHRRQHR